MSANALKTSRRHLGIRLVLIYAAPFVCLFIALFCGRYAIAPLQVLQTLGQAAIDLVQWCAQVTLSLFGAATLPQEGPFTDLDASSTLVLLARLPRALAAAAVGGALAASGAAYQGVFRNPLVNPGLLGVSNGASFGAALAIVFLGGGMFIYPVAFVFGVIAVLASYWIARVYDQAPTIMLILGGTIVSSVFSALVSLMKYLADPETQLPDIVYWLMGSLSSVTFSNFWAVAVMAVGCAMLIILSWRIDVLSMGDKEARSLGLEVNRDKGLIVCAATLATAAAVCMAGVVGWIGLIIPHIGRMLVGSENRRLVPVSIALGAAFLVLVDTCARCLWASEIPLGILTAIIGAPFFVYLLKKTKAGGWR